ncbi:MAG TPA: hypothetical protein VNX40_11325 [Mucilaginibacter sp.]|jgi:hypothetical protein|nr:hypothetical protein [Mucilaginibacter sp.]
MANFKSKDLTISIAEKGPAEPAGTACTCNTNIQQTNAGTIHPTTTIWHCTPTPIHCTPTPHCLGYSCYNFTCFGCSQASITAHTLTTAHCNPPNLCINSNGPEHNIAEVTDIDTLNALKEKLAGALKEVNDQLSKTK